MTCSEQIRAARYYNSLLCVDLLLSLPTTLCLILLLTETAHSQANNEPFPPRNLCYCQCNVSGAIRPGEDGLPPEGGPNGRKTTPRPVFRGDMPDLMPRNPFTVRPLFFLFENCYFCHSFVHRACGFQLGPST